MTKKQRNALELLQRARREDPTTSDGLIYGGATFYDSEVKVAYVNHHTAHGLRQRDKATFSGWAEWGIEITLTSSAASMGPTE